MLCSKASYRVAPTVGLKGTLEGALIGAFIVEAGKLEHGFRRIRARIPYNLP